MFVIYICNLTISIFPSGYVHSDPHPGNILVSNTDAGTKITLLDHGLYATLTEEFRLNYCQLWLAMIKSDQEGIVACHWS